ncbi:MAG: hypothetical protein ACE5LS_02685 [Thermoplasmata archaeon]
MVLDRAATETGVQATVTRVNGSYPVAGLRYKAVLLEEGGGRVIQEGNLTDLSPVTPTLSFHRVDASAEFLQPGDHFLMRLEGDVHLILLDGGGTPLGSTLGCGV